MVDLLRKDSTYHKMLDENILLKYLLERINIIFKIMSILQIQRISWNTRRVLLNYPSTFVFLFIYYYYIWAKLLDIQKIIILFFVENYALI